MRFIPQSAGGARLPCTVDDLDYIDLQSGQARELSSNLA